MDTSSEPLPPIELDREEGQFVTPDGERFLAMGTNMIAKGGFVQRWWGEFNTEVVKRSFKRMADAGLNTVRLFGFNQLEHLNVIREYARRYGIYVLVELGHEETRKKRIEKVREFASRYAGSNFVLGYDLRNEPYFWEVATIEEDGQRLHERYPETGPQDNWKHWNAYLDHAGFSTWFDKNVFSHIEGGMPKPANKKQRRAYEAVNGMLDRWIGWNERTIESSDPGRPMTVGYNTYLACLPANERLDFLAQHVYRPPHSFENVRANLTTMDRLADVWSGKPVSLGEFGLSNGGTLKNGKPIDVHSSAVGELMYYLYALAKGHMGVYKWQLFDFPVAAEKRLANWMRDAKRAKLRRQARFGMYYYDGTPDGAAKPIVHSLKFLRTYVNSGNKKGRIRLLKAPETTIKAGYRFRGEQALFVGHRRWKGKGLRFDTGDAIPTNLMVQWREDGVKLMSSRDVTVRLQPGHFVEGLTATNAELTGFYGSKRRKEKWLSVRLLSGETVTIGRW